MFFLFCLHSILLILWKKHHVIHFDHLLPAVSPSSVFSIFTSLLTQYWILNILPFFNFMISHWAQLLWERGLPLHIYLTNSLRMSHAYIFIRRLPQHIRLLPLTPLRFSHTHASFLPHSFMSLFIMFYWMQRLLTLWSLLMDVVLSTGTWSIYQGPRP